MWLYIPGHTSASVQGLADSTCQSGLHSAETVAASLWWRGKQRQPAFWSAAWKKGSFIRALCGLTSSHSHATSSVERWISSSPASPARPCLSPASDSARPTSGGCGPTSGKSFANWEPDTSSWRTYSGSCLPGMGAFLAPYSGTWPRAGSLRNGTCARRETWARAIKESGSSSSPVQGSPTGATPATRDWRDGRASEETMNRNARPLNEQAVSQWATPTASDDGDKVTLRTRRGSSLLAQGELWNTPAVPNGGRMGARTEEGREGQERHLEHQAVSASLWATPNAQCANDSQTHRSGDRTGELLLTGQSQAMSMWPTPDASVINDGEPSETFLARQEKLKETANNGNGCGTPLAMAAQLWGTPTAKDGESRPGKAETTEGTANLRTQTDLWGTPTVGDSASACNKTAGRSGESRARNHSGTTLTDGIRLFNAASDYTRPADDKRERMFLEIHKRQLAGDYPLEDEEDDLFPATDCPSSHPDQGTETHGNESSQSGPTLPRRSPRKRLNAVFTEYLMGLPLNWTSLKPLESTVFEQWEIQFARLQAALLSASSGRGCTKELTEK